jgi:FdhD protein
VSTPTAFRSVVRRTAEGERNEQDEVAAEEPLELRVEGKSVAVVMRTPGADRELAAGFLVTEGIIRSAREIFDITQCLEVAPEAKGNVLDVALVDPSSLDLARLSRHLFSASSCGICGKASIDAIRQSFPPVEDGPCIDAATIAALPEKLASAQAAFLRTGGLHACALFDLRGDLLAVREDVGRHNALDKLIGWALFENRLPLRECILLLSGRVSFEMMQKALAAGIPIVSAISAPTSLAIDFAASSRQTLIGFLRPGRMNIYTGANRLRGRADSLRP